MGTNFMAGESSVWVQPDGPNTKPQYLGCHGVGDITEPLGDSTVLTQPDPAKSGKYVIKNSFMGEKGLITTSIETDLRKVADYLESIDCPVPIYIHKVTCGRRDLFTNFDRSFVLRRARITQRTIGNLASRLQSNEGESTQSFDISAEELIRVFNLTANRVSTTETEDIVGLTVCSEDACEGDCGLTSKKGDVMYAATKHVTGSAGNKANVLVTTDGGTNWAATSNDPFAAGMDIAGITCFKVGKSTTRVLVGLGTTAGGAPLKIAYSDDGGATAWTSVTVGSTNAEYVGGNHAIFALDLYHVWVGSSGGRIYFSKDGGVTWSIQENAVISATAIKAIHFFDASYGYAVFTGGQVARTTDGGASWSATTVSGSSTAIDIEAVGKNAAWVAGTDGMFATDDGGSTWAKRNVYNIGGISFLNEVIGLAVGGGASGLIYQTIDGGYDWSALPLLANGGYTDVVMLKGDLAWAVGAANGGTGLIAKLTPAP